MIQSSDLDEFSGNGSLVERGFLREREKLRHSEKVECEFEARVAFVCLFVSMKTSIEALIPSLASDAKRGKRL